MRALTRLLKRPERAHVAAQRIFPPATLATICSLIADGAARHRADIRIIIDTAACSATRSAHASPQVHEQKPVRHPARARATQLFAEHRIWDTEQNCGVLLYINLTNRRVEIVADRDVNRALSPADWRKVCDLLTEGFQRGQFADSVIAALHVLHELLQMHYPTKTAHRDDGAHTTVIV